MEKLFGHDWDAIDRAQHGGKLHRIVDTSAPGDYGADPLPCGRFRMIPSGDIVDAAERAARLARRS